MPLHVYTARIHGCVDPDRFDITRMSGGPSGSPFAPTWEILKPAIAARKRAQNTSMEHGPVLLAEMWATYRTQFLAEMLVSSGRVPRHPEKWERRMQEARARGVTPQPESWAALLAKERVCLVCYCRERAQCHRGVLASEILPALGAVDCGEIESGKGKAA
jgi:hypothetical protein